MAGAHCAGLVLARQVAVEWSGGSRAIADWRPPRAERVGVGQGSCRAGKEPATPTEMWLSACNSATRPLHARRYRRIVGAPARSLGWREAVWEQWSAEAVACTASQEQRAVEQRDEADKALGGTPSRSEVPPRAPAVTVARAHRLAAYPRCSADLTRCDGGTGERWRPTDYRCGLPRAEPAVDLPVR